MKISELKLSFRNGFYLGLLLAAVTGIYLFRLWDAEHQVQLHSTHLLAAIEEKDWQQVGGFVAESYQDQWGHDRATMLIRLRQVMNYLRNLKVDAQESSFVVSGEEGIWTARIRIEADPNEAAFYVKDRVNVLEEPFEVTWRRQSWKPWDWQLTHVRNPALKLPTGMGY